MSRSPPREAAALPRVVLVDANVFFAPRMRDVFMLLRERGLVNLHWTKEIESEWTRNVIAEQGTDSRDIALCVRGMRDAAPDWEVTGYAKHAARFALVNANDRHVAAAAYKASLDDWPGQAVGLVTNNLKDFPQVAFAGTLVAPYSAAAYLDALHREQSAAVAAVVERCRSKLKAPPLTRAEYVAVLAKHGGLTIAAAMARKWRVECPTVDRNGKLHYESAERAASRRGNAGKA